MGVMHELLLFTSYISCINPFFHPLPVHTETCQLRDTNPKVALLTLQVTRLFMRLHPEQFIPLENMAFDSFFMRYGDTKGNLRCIAVENMCLLARQPNSSYQSIMEKLISPINFVFNKSPKVKEHIMYTILLFFRIFGQVVLHQQYGSIQNLLATGTGAGMSNSADIISQLSLLLGDNVVSVRQLAIDLFANFHASEGDTLLYNLEKLGIKRNILEKIQESVVTKSCNAALDPLGLSAASMQMLFDTSISLPSAYNQSSFHCGSGGDGSGSSSSSRARSASDSLAGAEDKISSSSSTSNRKRLTQTAPIAAMHNYDGSSSNGNCSNGAGNHNSNVPLSPAGTSNSGIFSSASGRTSPTISGKLVDIQECLFNASNYLSLLLEGPTPAGMRLYSDKEISRSFDKIQQDFSNLDDWNVRMHALSMIQDLVLGDAMEFESEFVHQCKNNIDALVAQVR